MKRAAYIVSCGPKEFIDLILISLQGTTGLATMATNENSAILT